jgi:hypothetical protein
MCINLSNLVPDRLKSIGLEAISLEEQMYSIAAMHLFKKSIMFAALSRLFPLRGDQQLQTLSHWTRCTFLAPPFTDALHCISIDYFNI